MIYFLTGASGVGKTTLVSQLKAEYGDKDWAFLHFDSIGVPAVEEMNAKYGSPSAWQEAMTYKWIDKLLNSYSQEKIFLEGQVNLKFIKKGFEKHDFTDYRIILIDCNEAEMSRRLKEERQQPELLTEDMKNWLKFLRNQAKEINIPIIDTGRYTKEKALEELVLIVQV